MFHKNNLCLCFPGYLRFVVLFMHTRFKDLSRFLKRTVSLDQCLDLCKISQEDSVPVKGQIIISLLSRDGPSGGTPLAVVGPLGDVRGPSEQDVSPSGNNDLPPGWEECRTPNGRLYYVNHNKRSTQWVKPQITNKQRTQHTNRSTRAVNGGPENDDNCNNIESESEVSAVFVIFVLLCLKVSLVE